MVVAAAGNRGISQVEFPADLPETIAVAAADASGARAGFSNYGEEVDLSAPGADVLSAFGDDYFANWSGTSFAAPLVSGGTALIAIAITDVGAGYSPVVVLTLLMIVTMTLSDVMNNTATAVIAAPIALDIANRLQVNPDPFLMAVAVAASCAFLTPIGHKNNTLVMGPGGYRFGDYWRMGLPLEILIVLVSIPMILWVWPF